MPRTSRMTFLRYALIAVIIFALIGLGGWYFFLRAQKGALEAADAGRGAGIAPPSFGGIIGSTYGNIAENLSSFIGGGDTGKLSTPPRLWQITKTPVAGAGFVTSNLSPNAATNTLPFVRFVERGTGYVVEANVIDGTLVRLTNTLVPRVYEALVGQNGVVVLRGLDEGGNILTNVARATSTSVSGSEPGALALSALAGNVRNIALKPSGEEVLLLIEDSGASLIRSSWDGKEPRRVGIFGVSGWQVHWLPDDRIVLVQNPADESVSFAYELTDKGLSPLVLRLNALDVLPRPNSSALLYGSAAGASPLFARVDADSSVITLPIRTSPDKCVWAPGIELTAYCAVPKTLPTSNSVNARLRGEIATADAWWKLDVSAGRAELLHDTEGGSAVSVENPMIDPSGSYIAFMNARDKSLWLLRVAK